MQSSVIGIRKITRSRNYCQSFWYSCKGVIDVGITAVHCIILVARVDTERGTKKKEIAPVRTKKSPEMLGADTERSLKQKTSMKI